ncbi:MAG: TolC family protein [Spirochaetes bacterium]|nr:TolC family protein [Spirochaetota bacterium]
MVKKLIVIAACICGVLASGFAQSSLSLQQLIGSALQSFELIKAEELKIDELEALRKFETQWKNPEVSAYYGSKSIDSQKGNVAGVSVLQPLYFPGKLSLADEIYRYKKNYQLLSHQEMKYVIASTVLNLGYEYAVSQRKSSHIATRIKRLKLINTYMSARPIVSPQKKVEAAIVKNTLRMLESEIYKIKTDQVVWLQRLKLYTRIGGPDLQLHVRWIENPKVFDVDEVVKKAKTESLLVKKQKELLLAASKEVALAQRNAFPDIGLIINYDYEKVAEKEQTIWGGLSIPIPVYNQNQNQIKATTARAKQEEYLMQYIEKMIEADIRTTLAHYEYYRNLLSLYPPGIEQELENTMYYADGEFQKGTITFQSYLELDVQTHETLERIYTTQLELVKTIAAIACITNDFNLLMEIAQ